MMCVFSGTNFTEKHITDSLREIEANTCVNFIKSKNAPGKDLDVSGELNCRLTSARCVEIDLPILTPILLVIVDWKLVQHLRKKLNLRLQLPMARICSVVDTMMKSSSWEPAYLRFVIDNVDILRIHEQFKDKNGKLNRSSVYIRSHLMFLILEQKMR